MPLPGLNDLIEGMRPRCACGEQIDVRTWYDGPTNTEIIDMRCHDKRYTMRIDPFSVRGYHNPEEPYARQIQYGERALQRECVTRRVDTFGSVVDSGYTYADYTMPDGRVERRVITARPRLIALDEPGFPPTPRANRPKKPAAPKPAPVVRPTFGKPIARRIIK